MASQVETEATEAETAAIMSRSTRYYLLHREHKLAKEKERYDSKPEVIAKREERERRRAEKAAVKTAADIKREARRAELQQKQELALKSSKKLTTPPVCTESL